jgi:hypothetical protein
MRYMKWIIGIGGVLVLVGASAQYPQGKPPTAEAFERAVAKSQQLRLEEEKFDSEHRFKGRAASGALNQLKTEGYQCRFDTLELSRIAKGTSATIEYYPAPVIVCLQEAKEASDICAARRVTLVVDWDGPVPPAREMPTRVRPRSIADRGFWCVERGEPIPR